MQMLMTHHPLTVHAVLCSSDLFSAIVNCPKTAISNFKCNTFFGIRQYYCNLQIEGSVTIIMFNY